MWDRTDDGAGPDLVEGIVADVTGPDTALIQCATRAFDLPAPVAAVSNTFLKKKKTQMLLDY